MSKVIAMMLLAGVAAVCDQQLLALVGMIIAFLMACLEVMQ